MLVPDAPTGRPALALMLLGVPAVAGADPRCLVPATMTQSLEEFERTDRSASHGPVVKCFSALHSILALVCESLFLLPAVAQVSRGGPPASPSWRDGLRDWGLDQERRLHGWGLASPECTAPSLQLRVTGALLGDLAAQFAALARRAGVDQAAAAAAQSLFKFQSAWSMALYYITCLQIFSLSAFDSTNELAFHLHKHRHRADPGGAWPVITTGVPRFRLSREDPLRHDGFPGPAVIAALRSRLAAGRRVRFAEVGVFRANLSKHLWRRAALARGSFEMHLVDHWGMDQVPSGSSRPSVGTGSNMAGMSNSSLFHAIVRSFSRTARCVQVPYWLPGGAPRAAVAMGGDVFFHRTASVRAARAFDDGSLDVVYIDADHKWWSVVQDLAAWWPKVRPGGALFGHDFHFNSLMEREGAPGGDSNDVPLAVLAFFRRPHEVVLHSGFAWSVEKPHDSDAGGGGAIGFGELCALLRELMAPHMEFEVCD